MNADKAAYGGSEYITSSQGVAPPLVTTPFKVVDSGVCSPRFVRSTLYCLPITSSLAGECRVPLGLVVQPLADIREGEVGGRGRGRRGMTAGGRLEGEGDGNVRQCKEHSVCENIC